MMNHNYFPIKSLNLFVFLLRRKGVAEIPSTRLFPDVSPSISSSVNHDAPKRIIKISPLRNCKYKSKDEKLL